MVANIEWFWIVWENLIAEQQLKAEILPTAPFLSFNTTFPLNAFKEIC